MKQEQFDKLPKWAKEEIRRLEYRIGTLEKQCEFYEQNYKQKTNTSFVFPSDFLDKKQYLPERTMVYFEFENGRRVRVMLLKRNGIEVLDLNGDDSLLITPQASNSTYIRMER